MWMCVTLWSRMLSTSCLIPCPCVVYVIRGNKDILIDWLIDRSLGCLTLIRPQQLQEQQHPFLSACAAFSCVQTMVWLPVFRFFNVRADVNARDCTQGLYTQHKKSALKGDSGRKKSLTHLIGESNPHQYCAWFFSLLLYPLSLFKEMYSTDLEFWWACPTCQQMFPMGILGDEAHWAVSVHGH